MQLYFQMQYIFITIAMLQILRRLKKTIMVNIIHLNKEL